MIRQHSTRNGSGTYQRMAAEVQGDAEGEIRNGYPDKVYVPASHDRRKRLLQALSYLNGNTAELPDAVPAEEIARERTEE